MNRPDAIRQPLAIALRTSVVLLLLILLHGSVPVGSTADMPLGAIIDRLFAAPVLLQLLRALVTLANAVLLSGLIVRYGLCPTRTYLPMPLYVLLSGLFLPTASASTLLIVLLLMLHLNRMTACFRRSYQFEHLFIASLYLGLTPMLSTAATPLLLSLAAALFLYRRTAREAIVALVGVALPTLFCSVIWWSTGADWNHMLLQWGAGLAAAAVPDALPAFTVSRITALTLLGLCGVLLLLAILRLYRTLPALRPRPRSIYLHILWLMLCSAATLFCCPTRPEVAGTLAALPATVLITSYLTFHGRRYALTVYLLLIAVALIAFISPFVI